MFKLTHLLLFILLVTPNLAVGLVSTNYHGWPAFILSNSKVEAVIVPSIGRVMQFRFVGDHDGPFWENRLLDGQVPEPHSSNWANFGGDKTWPAPQADWGKIAGRPWPPPATFDSNPVALEKHRDHIVLVSISDPHYQIRTKRIISLLTNQPVMSIITTYEKSGVIPQKVAVWTITQLKNPELISMPLPEKSIFPQGYNKQSDLLPANLLFTNNIVTCTRSHEHSTKIGSDASTLIWQNSQWILTIFSPRISGRDYPDQNSSAEIYTNPNPLDYVELEMLGPLETLSPGQAISQTNLYTLQRR